MPTLLVPSRHASPVFGGRKVSEKRPSSQMHVDVHEHEIKTTSQCTFPFHNKGLDHCFHNINPFEYKLFASETHANRGHRRALSSKTTKNNFFFIVYLPSAAPYLVPRYHFLLLQDFHGKQLLSPFQLDEVDATYASFTKNADFLEIFRAFEVKSRLDLS